jgi:hypothetical protein
VAHDPNRQRTVKDGNQHTQQQSGSFHEHRSLSLCMAPDTHNQGKDLGAAAGRR